MGVTFFINYGINYYKCITQFMLCNPQVWLNG